MNVIKQTQQFSSTIAHRIASFKNITHPAPSQLESKDVIDLSQDYSEQPPQFMRDYIIEATQTGSMQYTAPSGIPLLLESIAQFYKPFLKQKLNAMSQITVCPGSTATLGCALLALLNPNDEAVVFEPAYEFYRPQIEFIGAKYVGVPMKRQYYLSKQVLQNLSPQYQSMQDNWQIDWKALSSKLNERTKILIINTPHNPTGKIFSQEEMKEMAQILKKHPQVIIILDESYSSICFDPYQPFNFPRPFDHPDLSKRTLIISDAGQLFSSKGMGLGYAIGDESLITGIRSINQYNFFCVNEPFQKAIARAFDESRTNNYFKNKALQQLDYRNQIIAHLTKLELLIQPYISHGTSFVITDISKVLLSTNFFQNEGDSTSPRLTKDKAFVKWLMSTSQIQTYPLTNMYSKDFKENGRNLVRWSLCQNQDQLDGIKKRL